MEDRVSEVDKLQARLGVRWDAIRRARASAAEKRTQLTEGLADQTTDDASLVVFGSLARDEWTGGSDVDWTLLIDGQTYPEVSDAEARIRGWIDENFPGPGREGTFGGLSSSHDLVNRIGGKDDTNANLTQRILLLLESKPIGRADAHQRVIRALLERYINEDFGWLLSTNPLYVPRFLQNDIARYWRTVAVDFAYKRRDRAGEEWALRTVKLRLSRKLTYAAGLVACFRCSLLPDLYAGFAELPVSERAAIIIQELESFLRNTPLEMLAWAFLHFDELLPAADDVFGSYDRFLSLLDGNGREYLSGLRHEVAADDPTFTLARELGHAFQRGLNEIFLPEASQAFSRLTRIYGVF
jgi:predicted nucleotidyltransferase